MIERENAIELSVITSGWFRSVLIVVKCCALLTLAGINPGQACPVDNKHIEITVNGHTLIAEVAADFESHMCGLALRDELPPDHGMLFAYAEDQIVGFWMKDTFMPLSIAFLDADGKILEIHIMEPNNSTLRYISRVPARYALEVSQGWFKKNRIVIGDRAEFDLHDAGAEVFLYHRATE